MRLCFAFVASLPIALFAGCSHTNLNHSLVLDRVGPPAYESAEANGSLVVFSAISVDMPDNTLFTRHAHHTDYKIFSDDGRFLRAVHNDYDNALEAPREVELPAGKYRIVAQTTKYGTVTVPVLIAAHQVTRVNLTGTPSKSEKDLAGDTNLVRLPDGQVVGHFAPDVPPVQPHLAKDTR